MKAFMDQDFLLRTETAQKLFHDVAAKLPIIDYHCHLSPEEIANDVRFSNITEVWLGGDHYKWRLMRANGVDEKYITGDADPKEKFLKWAEVMDVAIGNPLYHWSHLELQRFFDYHGVFNSKTAEEVWEHCNAKLQEPEMSARQMIKNSKVTLVCTTDDPVDDLHWHREIKADESFDVQVLPAWRPDAALNLEKAGWADYLDKLSEVSGVAIKDFESLKEALLVRMDFFQENGCTVSDHGMDYVYYVAQGEPQVDAIMQLRLKGGTPDAQAIEAFKTKLMLFLAKEYHKRGWVMQLHYGVARNVNKPMFDKVGADTGYDVISNNTPSDKVWQFLNACEEQGGVPQTILYSLNPADNEYLQTIIGAFQNSDAIGKIQHGSAWWFNDTKQGMLDQLTAYANGSLLGNFIGMLTDSRSFLSYPRHEYFRRILCNLIGEWVENGEYPNDFENLKRIVEGICYNNAVRYFGFELEPVHV